MRSETPLPHLVVLYVLLDLNHVKPMWYNPAVSKVTYRSTEIIFFIASIECDCCYECYSTVYNNMANDFKQYNLFPYFFECGQNRNCWSHNGAYIFCNVVIFFLEITLKRIILLPILLNVDNENIVLIMFCPS